MEEYCRRDPEALALVNEIKTNWNTDDLVLIRDRLKEFNQHKEDFRKCLIAAKQLEWVLDNFEEIPRVVDLTHALCIVQSSIKSS